jgi:hypothetical protein
MALMTRLEATDWLMDIEAELYAMHVRVDRFCRHAGISRSQWYRWRRGQNAPLFTDTEKLQELVESLKREARKSNRNKYSIVDPRNPLRRYWKDEDPVKPVGVRAHG